MNSGNRTFLALSALVFICGFLISILHALLAPRLESAQRQAAEAIYFDTLQLRPGTAKLDSSYMVDDTALLGLRVPQFIYIARQDNHIVGIVLPLTAREGYSGDIDLLLGIDANSQIISVRVVSQHETRDLGDKIEPSKSHWLEQFKKIAYDEDHKKEWQLRSEGGAFDGITGATVTSHAVVKAVRQGLEYFVIHRDELLEEQRHE